MKNIIKKLSLFITVLFVLSITLGHVSVKAATVKISKKYATLEVDAVLQLKISGTSSTVKWSTSNKHVAGVTKKGKVVAYKEGTATITAAVGSSKYTCEVTVVDNNKTTDDTLKPSSKGVPKLKDSSEYEVVGSYTYEYFGYRHFIYLVDAKKTAEIELKLLIKDKKGNVLDTAEDRISLTKGKKNYFDLVFKDEFFDSDNSYTLTSKSVTSYHKGAEDAAKVTNYNKSDNTLYITVKQTNEDLGSFAELKMLFYKGDKLIYSEDCFYDVYAEDLEHKGDEAIMGVSIYGVDYTSIEFYYEDR